MTFRWGTPPEPGSVRVFTRTNVGRWPRGFWVDIPEGTDLRVWRQAKMVTDTDFAGNGAPLTLPSVGCCGQVR